MHHYEDTTEPHASRNVKHLEPKAHQNSYRQPLELVYRKTHHHFLCPLPNTRRPVFLSSPPTMSTYSTRR